MPLLISPTAGSLPALVEFRGFSALPISGTSGALVVWIASGGSPRQVAHWFASALALDPSPERFAASCLGRQTPRWRPLAHPLAHSRGVVEAWPVLVGSHRYRLALGGRGRTALALQCWRCYPQGLGWQRRCGPMALGAFIRHFTA